jgi:hypothetical protein
MHEGPHPSPLLEEREQSTKSEEQSFLIKTNKQKL